MFLRYGAALSGLAMSSPAFSVAPFETEHTTLNTEFIAHLRLDSRIAGYIIKVQ